ncbi:TIGR00730 family Rossman fold protein [Pyruvatibacter sp.]|uniref:LOG family protein n=1 Tax=Pyruvatibacter sp. TaxID=1981328 RepID=UPI0032ED88F7
MNGNIRVITVFSGSAAGNSAAYTHAARSLGEWLARSQIKLVYGGGGIGLMGVLARAAADADGEVEAIIPGFLETPDVMRDAPACPHIQTETLHDRMQMMAERADAFVVLPGGIGTIAEFVDILTWKQLGRHAKPIIILDTDGYWTPLGDLLTHIVAAGFSHGALEKMYCIVRAVDEIPAALEAQMD